jgi:hypothetical protein
VEPRVGEAHLGDAVHLVGYAYWQTTKSTGSILPSGESTRRSSVYALGPEVNVTTKYGKYFLRFYSEFGASNTSQGNVVTLGVVF